MIFIALVYYNFMFCLSQALHTDPTHVGSTRYQLPPLTEKSHAFHMQIMRGTHVTYM